MTPDPYTNSGRLSDPQSWNRYAYTRGDPVNRYDPSGLNDTVTVYGTYTALDYQTFMIYSTQQGTSNYYTAVGSAVAQAAMLQYSYWRATVVARLANAAGQLKAGAAQGKISDCEALAEFASVAAVQDGSSSYLFENDFQVLTPNSVAVYAAPGVSGQSGSELVSLGNNYGQASGFQSQYQDTISPAQDQGHHFAAFLQIGYIYGASLGSFAASAYETLEGTSNNTGDINLGTKAAQLGAALSNGSIGPSQVSDWIRKNICNK